MFLLIIYFCYLNSIIMWLLLYTYFSHTPSTKQRSTQPLNLFEFISTSQKPLLPAPVLSHFLCTLVIFHCVNSPTWFDLTSLCILVQWICFFFVMFVQLKKKTQLDLHKYSFAMLSQQCAIHNTRSHEDREMNPLYKVELGFEYTIFIYIRTMRRR